MDYKTVPAWIWLTHPA